MQNIRSKKVGKSDSANMRTARWRRLAVGTKLHPEEIEKAFRWSTYFVEQNKLFSAANFILSGLTLQYAMLVVRGEMPTQFFNSSHSCIEPPSRSEDWSMGYQDAFSFDTSTLIFTDRTTIKLQLPGKFCLIVQLFLTDFQQKAGVPWLCSSGGKHYRKARQSNSKHCAKFTRLAYPAAHKGNCPPVMDRAIAEGMFWKTCRNCCQMCVLLQIDSCSQSASCEAVSQLCKSL